MFLDNSLESAEPNTCNLQLRPGLMWSRVNISGWNSQFSFIRFSQNVSFFESKTEELSDGWKSVDCPLLETRGIAHLFCWLKAQPGVQTFMGLLTARPRQLLRSLIQLHIASKFTRFKTSIWKEIKQRNTKRCKFRTTDRSSNENSSIFRDWEQINVHIFSEKNA